MWRATKGENLTEDKRPIGDAGLTDTFLRNRTALATFIAARCGYHANEYHVDDLMQELWLRTEKASAQSIDRPLSYLFRTAHNLVLELGRTTRRNKMRDAAWIVATDTGWSAAVDATAERALLARERLALIDVALSRVGGRAAKIFRRFRIDGADQRQIAAELQVSLSTVEKDLRKAYDALEELKRRMDEV